MSEDRIAKPNDTTDERVAELGTAMKDLLPFFKAVQKDSNAWTQSPMSDFPIWDRALLMAYIDLKKRVEAFEDILTPASPFKD